MPQNIDSILDVAEQREASDVFLQEDEVPRLKINEQIIVLGEEPLSLEHITAFWHACGANAQGDGEMDRDSGFVSRTHTRYRGKPAPHHGPPRGGPAPHQDQSAYFERTRSA